MPAGRVRAIPTYRVYRLYDINIFFTCIYIHESKYFNGIYQCIPEQVSCIGGNQKLQQSPPEQMCSLG